MKTVRPAGPGPVVVAFVSRPHARAMARRVIPGRRGRLIQVNSAAQCLRVIRDRVVDAVLVDVGHVSEELWRVAALAADFPSAPFVAVAPLRATDGPALARCAAAEFAGMLVEGIDDPIADVLVTPYLFSARFVAAFREPPPRLALETELQRATWFEILRRAGRPVRTTELATALGLSREHLSRRFASPGTPNLKRVIDLVRLLAASQLAKNPGYDLRDVARVLGFASSSHLSSTAQRVVGARPASLASLRPVDLIQRFDSGSRRRRATA